LANWADPTAPLASMFELIVPLPMLAPEIVPVIPAAFTPPAKIAYGDGLIGCRGTRVTNPPAPLVRTAISNQRGGPEKTLAPKSSVAAKSPLLTGVAALVRGPATELPLLAES